MHENLAKLDDLGGPKTYNHYPNGWAMAFNTPFKMWKRYEFNGGTSDPCIISWPKGAAARGEIREHYHHAVDVVPTLLDLLGMHAPATIKGHVQSPFDGVSRPWASAIRRPAPRARRSSTACWVRTRSGTRAGRRSPPTPRSPAGAIAGAGLYIGRHGGEPITEDFPGAAPYRFTGGTLRQVTVNVGGKPYLDLEREAVLMLMRE